MPTYNVDIHKERHIPQADAKQQLPAYARKASIQSPQIRRRTHAHCTKVANSSVPVRQCPEFNNTNRIFRYTSINLPTPSNWSSVSLKEARGCSSPGLVRTTAGSPRGSDGHEVSDALAMVSRPAAFAALPQQGAGCGDINVLPGPSCPALRLHRPSIARCRRYVEVRLLLLAPCWRKGFFHGCAPSTASRR